MEGVPLDQVRYLVADGLYKTAAVAKFLADNNIRFVSKPGTNKRNAEGPVDPRDPDVVIYKGRGIVENVYADDQNFLAFAYRYDKLLSSFCGGFELTTWHYEGRPHTVATSMLPLCNGRATPARPSAMRREPTSTGVSGLRMPELNWIVSIPPIPRLIKNQAM